MEDMKGFEVDMESEIDWEYGDRGGNRGHEGHRIHGVLGEYQMVLSTHGISAYKKNI